MVVVVVGSCRSVIRTVAMRVEEGGGSCRPLILTVVMGGKGGWGR